MVPPLLGALARGRSRRRLVVVVLLSAAQGGACAAPGPAPAAASQATSAPAGLPRCLGQADIERLHGQRVILEGRYEVEPVPGGKRLQAVVIVLPDRTRVLRAYRPIAEEFGFVERRVVVIGVILRDAGEGPRVQQVLAPHVRPERIDLAPGEGRPVPAVNPELPSPSVVATAAAFDARDDRYVQAWVRLVELRRHAEDGMWANATLVLKDGTTIVVRAVVHERWEPLLGTPVTAVGLAVRAAGGEPRRLSGRVALCAGWVERCDLMRRHEPGP